MPELESLLSDDELEDSEVDGEGDLVGSLRTRLCWDADSKSAGVLLRQYLATPRAFVLKHKTHLNTATGAFNLQGHLVKTWRTNQPSVHRVHAAAKLQSMRQALIGASGPQQKQMLSQVNAELRALDIDPDVLLPAGWKCLLFQDWFLAPGLTYNSSRQGALGVRPALLLRKSPQVIIHSPKTELHVQAKGSLEVEPNKSNQVHATAGLRLKLYKSAVTTKQDLVVSMGVDLVTRPLSASMAGEGARSWLGRSTLWQYPYLKVSENNTAVKLQRGQWTFLYEL